MGKVKTRKGCPIRFEIEKAEMRDKKEYLCGFRKLCRRKDKRFCKFRK